MEREIECRERETMFCHRRDDGAMRVECQADDLG